MVSIRNCATTTVLLLIPFVPAIAVASAQESAPPAEGKQQGAMTEEEMKRRIKEEVERQLKEMEANRGAAGVTPAGRLGEKPEGLTEFLKHMPFDLHGGALLWSYTPFQEGVKNKAELYDAYLTFDVPFNDFGFHFEPRFRDSKLRPFFQSNVWVQEIYTSWKIPEIPIGTLKAGKEYSRFGRFWDGSFFGNIPYFDGMKLDPDIGLSLENTVDMGHGLDLTYSAQYFVNDGGTNG